MPTTHETLAAAIRVAEAELCLPVKVYFGHAIELRDQVDLLFVPRVISIARGTYTCPKFFGLPDMLRALNVALPPIIAPTFNKRLHWQQQWRAVYEAGRPVTANPARIALAWHQAVANSLPGLKAPSPRACSNRTQGTSMRIGIAGHPYNLYDRFLSSDLFELLTRRGATVLTPEDVSSVAALAAAKHLPKALYWSHEREVVGTVFHWRQARAVDGIVYLRSFACGPDSIAQSLFDHETRRSSGPPMISITLDEHTGELGLVTRIDAFIDMLGRRARLQ